MKQAMESDKPIPQRQDSISDALEGNTPRVARDVFVVQSKERFDEVPDIPANTAEGEKNSTSGFLAVIYEHRFD